VRASISARLRERDEIGERGLRLLIELARRRLVMLDIDAQRCPDRVPVPKRR
jgi:hypothetical protein